MTACLLPTEEPALVAGFFLPRVALASGRSRASYVPTPAKGPTALGEAGIEGPARQPHWNFSTTARQCHA
jgi:hypothetical protein